VPASISRYRLASYFLVAAILAAIAGFKLGAAAIAGVFSYTILEVSYRKVAQTMPDAWARWVSLTVFLLTATLVGWSFWRFLHQSLTAVPDILENAIPRLSEMSMEYGVDLPFENIDELRGIAIRALKENARDVTAASGLMTKRFFYVLIGIFIAVFCFMGNGGQEPDDTLYGRLGGEMQERVSRFLTSFERVMGAQVIISGINTVFTAVFLVGFDFPHTAFLIPATFIFGVLPVIGNLMSNTVIVCTALTISPKHAVFALGLLIIIHKGEYFLNSRVIGSTIQVPAWQMLLAILLGEAFLGVPGIVLAPALLHYVRSELRDIPAR
jgi:predicted PurR-regulated permease PerM